MATRTRLVRRAVRITASILILVIASVVLMSCESAPVRRGPEKSDRTKSAVGSCGDGSPILVVTDSVDSSNALNFGQYFVSEILRTEGLMEFSESALTELDSTCIATHDVVILPSLALTSGQTTLFSDYVDGGGFLIGLRPDQQLASVFNVTPEPGHFCGYYGYEQDAGPVTEPTRTVCNDAGSIVPGTAAECTDDALPSGKSCAWGMTTWIGLDTSHPVASGLESRTMKIHGAAKKYSLGTGTQQIGTIYSDVTTPTAFPAVTYYAHAGGGRAAMFAYDLAESLVTTRQGNPWLAGKMLSITVSAEYKVNRAAQMFVDQRLSPPSSWNETLHGDRPTERNSVPQADEQMHLLTNLLIWATTVRPLPRSWYYDNGKSTMLSFSSDGCVGSAATEATMRSDVRVRGGNMAFYSYSFLDNTAVPETWQTNDGDEVSIHFNTEGCPTDNDTNPIDYNDMKTGTENRVFNFGYAYSSLTPETSRNHCLTWASLGPQGQLDPAAQARIFSGTTIALDSSYSTFPNSFGYMTGSGLPMRYVDSCGVNKVTSVYQLATQFEDDVQGDSTVADTTSLRWHASSQKIKYHQALSENFSRYHGIMNPLFHGGDWDGSFKGSRSGVPLLDHARATGIPIVPPRVVNAVWAARRALHFDNVAYSADTLTFTATGASQSQTILLPARFGTRSLAAVALDSTPAPVAIEVFHGVAYARVVLPSAGDIAVSADYAAAYSISGSVGATAAGATKINLTGHATADSSIMINQTVQPDENGDYHFKGLWPGSYVVSAISDSYQFSPSSQPITLTSSDAIQDFTPSAGALAIGAGYSLHTTEVPSVDPASVTDLSAYELGMRFTPAVDGVITHIKFWKTLADENSSTNRIATLWDASSQTRLASVTWTHAEEVGQEGWLQKALPGPIAVVANSTYVVSVSSKKNYVYTPSAFDTVIVNRSLSSDTAAAGVYNTSVGSYPLFGASSNYFRDIVFVPRDVAVFTTQAPGATNGSGNYELGMKFTVDVNGEVKAIRYWRAPGESTSGHTGRIWTATGAQLASVAFSNETACPAAYTTGCWQQQTLSTPLELDAGTYVVSVNTQSSKYVYTTSGLASAVDSGPIHAIGGSNGVYNTTSGSFPTTSYNNSNYFRDVIFEPGRSRSLIASSTTPSNSYNDSSYELGTILYSDVPGYISAIRFYKSASFDGGVHVGKIWNAGGQILAAVVFENETASGWQQQTLPIPLLIAPDVRYTVSVNTGHDNRNDCISNGDCAAGSGVCVAGKCLPKYGYVATPSFFSSQVSAGHLHSETSAAGVYGAIGTLPTTTYNSNGYFRDVVFVPN